VEEHGRVLAGLGDDAEVVDEDRPRVLAGREESECPEARELLGEARQLVEGRVDDDHLAYPTRRDPNDLGAMLVGEHRVACAEEVVPSTRSLAPRVLDGVLNVPKQARRVAALTLDADLAALAFDDQGSPVEQNQTIELCAIVVEVDVSLGPGKEPAQIPNGQAIEGLCALLREAPTAGEQARPGGHPRLGSGLRGRQVLALVLQNGGLIEVPSNSPLYSRPT
jgi:hypothetical protein